MRREVEGLCALGPLPDSDAITDKHLEEFDEILRSIERPVSDEEAVALSLLFGSDDCFGLA